MTSTNIDYVKTYFDYPVLTKIHGEPTYESLQEIKDQLKTNAATVTCELGGGANGHLGLVLTPLEYILSTMARYSLILVRRFLQCLILRVRIFHIEQRISHFCLEISFNKKNLPKCLVISSKFPLVVVPVEFARMSNSCNASLHIIV